MAKLRKMLGSVEDPRVADMMRMIETQSKATLAHWAVSYAEEHFLDIYERVYPEDSRLKRLISSAKELLDGRGKLADVKALLKEARQAALEAESSPAAQAAARAVFTACGVVQTPTNALGFTFYGAAAAIYDEVGLRENQEYYDGLAAQELDKMAASLEKVLVPNEEDPVKVNWYC